MAVGTVFTNQGEDWACRCMAQTDADDGRYVGWGTGSTTPAKADTNLQTPAAEARVAGAVSTTGVGASAKYQNVATLTSASLQTIQEVGNFETSGATADIIIHCVHAAKALDIGDQIVYTITLDPG
jgi:hypothetical protein